MKKVFFKTALVVLLLSVIVIKVWTLNSDWVENFYSTGIYVPIGRAFRFTFGWLPFSLGDLLYFLAAIYLLVKIVRLIIFLSRREFSREQVLPRLQKIAVVSAAVYIIFNVNWGLNYNRLGIGYQLKIKPFEHTRADLTELTAILVKKLNETKRAIKVDKVYPSYSEMFTSAQQAYQNSTKDYPFIRYNIRSIKGSLYGTAGNYLGFLGYYNPFTGESQLNLTQPAFLLPFVICHEMAHQLGYANESEANFVGYLTAIHSKDTLFHYSAYFDLFNYANKELSVRDSLKARENYRELDTLVKKDFIELRNFYKKYKNPFEPIIKLFYDQYLKANQQDKGVESYNQVVGLLIAYYKKYGKV